MKFLNINRPFTWIITVLLILNLSALVTIVYHLRKNAATDTQNVLSARNFERPHQLFYSELDLNDEQIDQFRELRRDFFEGSKVIMQDINNKNMEMLEVMSELHPDKERLNEISHEIGGLHALMRMKSIENYMKMKEICTPQQQEKLDSIYLQIFLREGPPRGYGRQRHFRGRRMQDQNSD